jgi:hypothetical protein
MKVKTLGSYRLPFSPDTALRMWVSVMLTRRHDASLYHSLRSSR